MVTIYALICPFTGEVRYIGQTVYRPKRLRDHIGRSASENVKRWVAAVRERGRTVTVADLCTVKKELANAAEKLLIRRYRNRVALLLNCTHHANRAVSRDEVRASFKGEDGRDLSIRYWIDKKAKVKR